MQETNNILAILDNYLHDNPDEIAKEMANDFRKRRIEKNLTREQVADTSEIKNVFSQPKYSTMEELQQIKRNANKKKAYRQWNI